jgi:hypothetical protein
MRNRVFERPSLFIYARLLDCVCPIKLLNLFKRQTFRVFRNPEGQALLAPRLQPLGFSVLYFFRWS